MSEIKVFHNNKRAPLAVDQFYQGWFHYRINPERGTLEPGKNKYTIVAYNERGREICRIKKEIEVE